MRRGKLTVSHCQGKSFEFLSDGSKTSRNGDSAAHQLCQVWEPILFSLIQETTDKLYLCGLFIFFLPERETEVRKVWKSRVALAKITLSEITAYPKLSQASLSTSLSAPDLSCGDKAKPLEQDPDHLLGD